MTRIIRLEKKPDGITQRHNRLFTMAGDGVWGGRRQKETFTDEGGFRKPWSDQTALWHILNPCWHTTDVWQRATDGESRGRNKCKGEERWIEERISEGKVGEESKGRKISRWVEFAQVPFSKAFYSDCSDEAAQWQTVQRWAAPRCKGINEYDPFSLCSYSQGCCCK